MENINKQLAIGIFDSGMGGVSVLSELIKLMPNESYIYYGDSFNAPYGIKEVDKIVELSVNVCDFLIAKGVKAIVVACNTATSASIKILRQKYDIPIIGMEPAIKPAIDIAEDKNVVVMATPITLKEKKFNNLITKLGVNEKVIKLPAPELVKIVESGKINNEIAVNQIKKYFEHIDMKNIGAIVLGCTHFIFLKEVIQKVVGLDIPLIDGNLGTAKHLKNILSKKNLFIEDNIQETKVDIYNSSEEDEMIELSKKLLDIIG